MEPAKVLTGAVAMLADSIAETPDLRDELIAYWQGRKGPLTAPGLGRIRYADGGECPPVQGR